MPKPAGVVFGFYAVVGSALLGVALFSGLRTRSFLQTAGTAEGVVVRNVYHGSKRGAGTYFPRVRFRTARGQDQVVDSHFGAPWPSYQAGDRVRVFYDPDDPAHFSINSFWSLWFAPVWFGGMGVVLWSIVLIPYAWARHVQKRDDWIRANGQRVLADFERVEVNTEVRVKGRHPWRIVCRWLDPASNQTHAYRSQDLWCDPAKHITGKTLEVMVDPTNPKRYVVDTSFLPKLAE